MTPKVRKIVYPLISFVVLVAVWQFSIDWFKVPNYLLPTPSAVLNALCTGYIGGGMWRHLFFTLQSTTAGYLIGCGLAIVTGALLAEFETVRDFAQPYVIALQSMPKV